MQFRTLSFAVLFGVALIAASVPAEASLMDGLLTWYKLDGIPDPVIDSAGSNDGMNFGATHSQQGAGAGFGNSFEFDGNDDYISFGDVAELDGLLEMSLSAWIKTDGGTPTDSIIRNDDMFPPGGTTLGFALLQRPDGAFSFQIETDNDVYDTVDDGSNTFGDFRDGEWHNVVSIYDGAMISIYVDGIYQQSVAASGTIRNVDSLTFGNGPPPDAADFWSGALDDVGIWDRALTMDEIAYLSANPIPEPSTGLLLGLGLVTVAAKRRRVV